VQDYAEKVGILRDLITISIESGVRDVLSYHNESLMQPSSVVTFEARTKALDQQDQVFVPSDADSVGKLDHHHRHRPLRHRPHDGSRDGSRDHTRDQQQQESMDADADADADASCCDLDDIENLELRDFDELSMDETARYVSSLKHALHVARVKEGKIRADLVKNQKKLGRNSHFLDVVKKTLYKEVVSLKEQLYRLLTKSGDFELEIFDLFDYLRLLDEDTQEHDRMDLLERLRKQHARDVAIAEIRSHREVDRCEKQMQECVAALTIERQQMIQLQDDHDIVSHILEKIALGRPLSKLDQARMQEIAGIAKLAELSQHGDDGESKDESDAATDRDGAASVSEKSPGGHEVQNAQLQRRFQVIVDQKSVMEVELRCAKRRITLLEGELEAERVKYQKDIAQERMKTKDSHTMKSTYEQEKSRMLKESEQSQKNLKNLVSKTEKGVQKRIDAMESEIRRLTEENATSQMKFRKEIKFLEDENEKKSTILIRKRGEVKSMTEKMRTESSRNLIRSPSQTSKKGLFPPKLMMQLQCSTIQWGENHHFCVH
jgi:hypothetical protein